MKFSVIIPIYNVEKYLKECLDSVLAQTFKDFEVIAVDDGSTDESGKIAEEYAENDKRIKVIHQENKGLGGARNTGLANAQGEYLIFLDSDDYISKDLLESLDKCLITNDMDILVYDFIIINEQGEITEKFSTSGDFKSINIKEFMLLAPSAVNKAFRRALFLENNIFFPERLWYEDLATTLRIGVNAPNIGMLEKGLYYYRQRGGSIMHNTNVGRNLEIMTAFQLVLDYYQQTGRKKEYYKELEWLCYLHVLYYTAYRLLAFDCHLKEMKQLRQYCIERFPDWKSNVYISEEIKKDFHMEEILEGKWLQFYLAYGFRNKIKKILKRI